MTASMRPLTLGEILDRTIQLYRRNFALMMGISVLPAAIDVLISGGLAIFLTERVSALAPPVAGKAPDLGGYAMVFLAAGIFLVVGVPILLSVFSLALSALTYAALALSRGEGVSIRGSYRFALGRFWRSAGILSMQFLFAAIVPGIALTGLILVIGIGGALLMPKLNSPAAAITFGLLIFALMLALAAVCMWIWIRFCLAFPASVAEDKKTWPAMRRSGQLSKGTLGRIFVMYLMVGILTIVVYYALIIPLDLAMGMRVDKLFAVTHTAGYLPVLVQSVNLLITFVERAFVMPIYATALVLFYTDQRTRLEGYDIEQLITQADWPEYPSVVPTFSLVEDGASGPLEAASPASSTSTREPGA